MDNRDFVLHEKYSTILLKNHLKQKLNIIYEKEQIDTNYKNFTETKCDNFYSYFDLNFYSILFVYLCSSDSNFSYNFIISITNWVRIYEYVYVLANIHIICIQVWVLK